MTFAALTVLAVTPGQVPTGGPNAGRPPMPVLPPPQVSDQSFDATRGYLTTVLTDHNRAATRGRVTSGELLLTTRRNPVTNQLETTYNPNLDDRTTYARQTAPLAEAIAALDPARPGSAAHRLLNNTTIPITPGANPFDHYLASADRIAYARTSWVNAQLRDLDEAIASGGDRVQALARGLRRESSLSPEARARYGSSTRDPETRRPVFTEGTANADYARHSGALRTQLRAMLEARFNAQRDAWVAREVREHQDALAADTVLAFGGVAVPRHASAPAAPATPLPGQTGVYALTQGPYTIHLRRDPDDRHGAWQWCRVPQTGEQPNWRAVNQRFTDPSEIQGEANLAAARAVNAELLRLQTTEISHYVVTRESAVPASAGRPASTVSTVIHLRPAPSSGANPVRWQWGRGLPDGATDWLPVGTPLNYVAGDPRAPQIEEFRTLFADVDRRQATPPPQLGAERIAVDRVLQDRIIRDREQLVQSFLTGEGAHLLGFSAAPNRPGTWFAQAGGCEVELTRNADRTFTYRYRFRQDGQAERTTSWSAPAALPTQERQLPSGRGSENNQNSAVEGLIVLQNRLVLLADISRAGTRREQERVRQAVGSELAIRTQVGPSHDPGENMLRVVFGARSADGDTTNADASPTFGPGVLRANLGGREYLFRRYNPTSRSGPGELDPYYGRWQVALPPAAPQPGQRPADPEWVNIGFNPTQGFEQRVLGANQTPHLTAVLTLLSRLNYQRHWVGGALHPVVEHLYHGENPGSAIRRERSRHAGEQLLAHTGYATRSGPNEPYRLEIPQAGRPAGMPTPLIRQDPQAGGVWQISLDNGSHWHRANSREAFYDARTAGAQRYNIIFRYLGELTEGIDVDLTRP